MTTAARRVARTSAPPHTPRAAAAGGLPAHVSGALPPPERTRPWQAWQPTLVTPPPASACFTDGWLTSFAPTAGGTKVARLQTDDGSTAFHLTEPFTCGTYGAVGYARAADGTILAYKELVAQPGLAPPNCAIKVSRSAHIEREAAMPALLGMPMAAKAQIRVGHRYFLVQPLLAANAEELVIRSRARHVAALQMRGLARELAAQTAQQLSCLHAQGHVFGDYKLANCGVTEDGAFCLLDFGMTVPIGTGLRGRRGSPYLMAPELHDNQLYGAEIDIWSAAIAYCDMLVPRQESPLSLAPHGVSTRSPAGKRAVLDGMRDNVLNLLLWRHAVVDDGHLDVAKLTRASAPNDAYARHFSYYQKVYAADPEVCTFLLEGVLGLGAQARQTMAALHATLRALQPETGQASQAARTLAKSLAKPSPRRQQMLADLATLPPARPPEPTLLVA